MCGVNFLRILCYDRSNRVRKSLGKWMTIIHSSKRLWPFYYSSENNMLYQGYQEDWHDNKNTNVMDINAITRTSSILYLKNKTQHWNIFLMTQSLSTLLFSLGMASLSQPNNIETPTSTSTNHQLSSVFQISSQIHLSVL